LARAGHLYRGYRNYDGAFAELEASAQNLPNDPRMFELKGYIERRRPGGNEADAVRNLERAIEMDPRNVFLLRQTSNSYRHLRRYAEEAAILSRAIAIEPENLDIRVSRAEVEYYWKANIQPLHQVIEEIRTKDPAKIRDNAEDWITCAMAERDPVAAANAIAALGQDSFGEVAKLSPRFMEGLIARMTKDDAKAYGAFTAARTDQEKLVLKRPDDAGALCVLGLIDAALGRKEEALDEGRRAAELLPVEKDAINGALIVVGLARIAAWVGDSDLACEHLARANSLPSSGMSYGQLKLQPWWDPLRGNPCFETIVASLAPKEN
jgi:tetratricopeptide (TPR) repeat protein